MARPDDADSDVPAARSRLRFELLLALGLLAFGLVILPALIYVTGTLLLGAYAGGGHLGAFYGDFLRDLASGAAPAWILLLGPCLLMQLGRLLFLRFGGRHAARGQHPSPPPPQPQGSTATRGAAAVRERREPTIRF